jgi:peptide/nickel transport system substrate-binding protein
MENREHKKIMSKCMKPNMILAVFTATFLLLSFSAQLSHAAPPIINRQMEIIEATTEGNDPSTVDPAFCYDTASGELLMNCYDTLVFFDGERMDGYLPQLATEWSIVQNSPPIRDPETGLDWAYTYFFRIRTGVKWHNPAFGTVTPEDVEYCFERGMVIDPVGGPQWMFYEPLLNGASRNYVNGVEYDPVNVVADAIYVGKCIDHAVESNSTHVWFNLAFPGAYAPFVQILSSPSSSIYCKAWANSLGRVNWDGTWGAYTDWVAYCNPPVAPFDDPVPVLMGSGPFILANLDRVLMYWDAMRFTNYWRGWGSGPAPNYGVGWPAFGASRPAGYVDHFKVTWAYNWIARSTLFLNGEVDYCAVPRQYRDQVLGQPNVRCMFPLPTLSCMALLYNFDVDPSSPYGTIYDYGVLGEDGIPRDFFGNSNYGIYIRKAFSNCINFARVIETAYLFEAMQPATAIVPVLPYYDPTIPNYTMNLTKAAELFRMWPGLWEEGFTIQLVYNLGNLAAQTVCNDLEANIESLNPRFMVQVVPLTWSQYLAARNKGWLPAYTVQFSADYPDPHDFAFTFYSTNGAYAAAQGYSNAAMDALIDQGIRTPNGPARAAFYTQIQQLAIDDCPSVAVAWEFGRHFELSWIVDWYYNPLYQGNYVANTWKWYYTPHAQMDSVTGPVSNNLPYDVNYDGKTNMVDIGTTAASFMCIYGPPMSTRWVFRCDFNNDRKIDMKDIGFVAKNFGKLSFTWTPSL